MTSIATRRFWQLLNRLPVDVQVLAGKNYDLWVRNPQHPSLQFKRLGGSKELVSVRIGDHYRAIGTLAADQVTWLWIGTHAEYDRLTRT
jgi:hypothetical protein